MLRSKKPPVRIMILRKRFYKIVETLKVIKHGLNRVMFGSNTALDLFVNFFKTFLSSPVPSVGNPLGGDDLQESLTQQLHQLQLQQQQNELLAQQAAMLRHGVDNNDRNA